MRLILGNRKKKEMNLPNYYRPSEKRLRRELAEQEQNRLRDEQGVSNFSRPMPIERIIQQCAAWLSLLIWIAAIVLPFFGVFSWWISIPIAIIWQGINGWIAFRSFKLILPPDKFAEVVKKINRDETL